MGYILWDVPFGCFTYGKSHGSLISIDEFWWLTCEIWWLSKITSRIPEGKWWDITNQQHWYDIWVCLIAVKKTRNSFGDYVFPFFVFSSVVLSVFPAISCNLQHFGTGNSPFKGIATFWGSNRHSWQPRKRNPITGSCKHWVALNLNVYQKGITGVNLTI